MTPGTNRGEADFRSECILRSMSRSGQPVTVPPGGGLSVEGTIADRHDERAPNDDGT